MRDLLRIPSSDGGQWRCVCVFFFDMLYFRLLRDANATFQNGEITFAEWISKTGGRMSLASRTRQVHAHAQLQYTSVQLSAI